MQSIEPRQLILTVDICKVQFKLQMIA